MQPLKRKIEDRSISALRTLIDDHPTMEEFFQKCDKGLSWDGHIRLYQNDESANDKANYDDDVPVQIKGHVVKEEQFLNNERITTPVSLEDLRVYYRSFGCIYFVIYMNKDASALEIYYSSLYPSKIKRYLEAASQKGNKSSISIPFLKLEKNSMELYHICKQFSFEMAKQGSGKGQIVPNSITFEKMAQVNQITATSIGVSTPYDFLKGISSGDIAFYGSIDSSGIQYPIQAKMSASLKQTIESPIYIKNKQYYSSFELRTIVTDPDQKNYVRDGTHIISPSPNLSLRITKSQINFTFRFETDLIHLKKDAEFVLNLLKEQKLGIFDGQMWLNNPIIGKDFINQLYNIVAIGTVLDEINCNIMVPYKI